MSGTDRAGPDEPNGERWIDALASDAWMLVNELDPLALAGKATGASVAGGIDLLLDSDDAIQQLANDHQRNDEEVIGVLEELSEDDEEPSS